MDSYITNKLKSLYPEKNVERLSVTYPSLYKWIGVTAREKNQTIKEYLKGLGFVYVVLQRGVQSSFDSYTAKLLLNEFGITQVDLAKWQGVSRQAISQKINNNTQESSWATNELSLEEQAIVLDMIENRSFTIYTDELTVAIRSNYEKAVIIIINEESTKVIIDLPEYIQQAICEHQLDIFTETDFEIKKQLYSVTIMGEQYASCDPSVRNKVRRQSSKRGITEEEYCQLHGFKGIANGRIVTDEELMEIIKQYVVEKN